MQTLHRLRTDQLQLTSSGCHFVADNFRLASRFFDLPTSNHTPYNQPPKTSTATTTAIAVAPAAQHSRRPAAQHEPSNTCTNEICRLWTWTHNRLTTSPTDNIDNERHHRTIPPNDTTERHHRTTTPNDNAAHQNPHHPTRNETLPRRSSNRCSPRAANCDTQHRTATPDIELRHSIPNFDTRHWTATPETGPHIHDFGLRHPLLA
jgi:hypothetical protein